MQLVTHNGDAHCRSVPHSTKHKHRQKMSAMQKDSFTQRNDALKVCNGINASKKCWMCAIYRKNHIANLSECIFVHPSHKHTHIFSYNSWNRAWWWRRYPMIFVLRWRTNEMCTMNEWESVPPLLLCKYRFCTSAKCIDVQKLPFQVLRCATHKESVKKKQQETAELGVNDRKREWALNKIAREINVV